MMLWGMYIIHPRIVWSAVMASIIREGRAKDDGMGFSVGFDRSTVAEDGFGAHSRGGERSRDTFDIFI